MNLSHTPLASGVRYGVFTSLILPATAVKCAAYFYRGRESDISVLSPTASLPVTAAPSIYQLGILLLLYVLFAAFSVPLSRIHTIAETTNHTQQ